MHDDCYTLATHCQITELDFKFKPYVQLALRQQKPGKQNRMFQNDVNQALRVIWRLLIRIRSVNRSKWVKLGFKYDHVAPSGFGIAPIKRVPTAMFSLVRIRPIFEQEAPK